MDVDTFIKLGEAEQRAAEGQVALVGHGLDVLAKVPQIQLGQQQVVAAKLDNLAKHLKIKWDSQSHTQLLRIRNQSLQAVKHATNEADLIRRRANCLGALLSGGGSWDAIRDGWVAFMFFYARMAASIYERIGKIAVSADAYEPVSWQHPDQKPVLSVSENYRNFGGMVYWARTYTYQPRFSGAAWQAIAECMTIMEEHSAARLVEVESRIAAAEAVAKELEGTDWSRLKTS